MKMTVYYDLHAIAGILILICSTGGSAQYTCRHPHSCMPTSACVKLHDKQFLNNQFLFKCDDGSLCCPPAQKAPPTAPTSAAPSSTQGPAASPVVASTTDETSSSESELEQWEYEDEFSAAQNQQTDGRDGRQNTLEQPLSAHPFSMPWEHKNQRLLPDSCGRVPDDDRITAGSDARPGEYPWMALVGFTGNANGMTAFVCAASLISDRYVLTAAHCLHKPGAKLTHVRLGEYDTSTPEDCTDDQCLPPAVDFAAEKVIAHDKWNEKTFRNDIGLIRLNRSALSLGYSTIAPICLPLNSSEFILTTDFKYDAVGWGLTGWREHRLSERLQKTVLNGIADEACNAIICPDGRIDASYCPILASQVCAQGRLKRDVCKGDSGGPLMAVADSANPRTVQLAITSFKATEVCGEDNIPSVFTRVDKYIEWILDHLEP